MPNSVTTVEVEFDNNILCGPDRVQMGLNKGVGVNFILDCPENNMHHKCREKQKAKKNSIVQNCLVNFVGIYFCQTISLHITSRSVATLPHGYLSIDRIPHTNLCCR